MQMMEVIRCGQRLIFHVEKKPGIQKSEEHKLLEKTEGAKAGLTAASGVVLLITREILPIKCHQSYLCIDIPR